MTHPFPGFPEFRANVTFVPLQFFTVVLPHRSRGCVRLVGFMIRRLLGWVDTEGNPTHEQLEFSYRELVNEAGLSRDSIAEALAEAQAHQLIECVRAPRPDGPGHPAQSGLYALRWGEIYTDSPDQFAGFFRKHQAGQVVALGILLPIDEMIGRRDIEGVGKDRSARMWRRTQAHDLRPQIDQPVVVVVGDMAQGDVD